MGRENREWDLRTEGNYELCLSGPLTRFTTRAADPERTRAFRAAAARRRRVLVRRCARQTDAVLAAIRTPTAAHFDQRQQ